MLFCMWISSFANTACWSDYPFPTVFCRHPCWRSIDYICELICGLFILLHWSICLFYTNTVWFKYCSFVIHSWNQDVWWYQLCTFAQDIFGYLKSSLASHKFRIFFLLKKTMLFDKHCIIFFIALGSTEILSNANQKCNCISPHTC